MTSRVLPGLVVQGKKKPLHQGLPRRLKEARKAVKVPLTRLSVSAGLSRSTAANIEAGAMPRIDEVERMARVLRVPACWLAFGREGRRPWREKTPREVRERDDIGVLSGLGMAAEDSPRYGPAKEAPPALSCEGVGARLRKAREAAGLGFRPLGRAAGTSDTAVRLTEEGRTMPTVATVEALAKALGVSPCWLAFGAGEGPASAPLP